MLPLSAEIKGNLSFRTGVQAGISLAIGYMPIAFAYGLLSKTTGLTFWETVAMSAFVFAGASQYTALSMIAAGANLLEIVLTTFFMNIRHLLMSTSINEKVEPDKWWKKALYGFMITDESFSVAATREEKMLSTPFMFGLGVIGYGSWVVNSALGYLIGAGLPQTLQTGMAVALYAMFIGLLVPAAKKSRKVILLAGTAAILNSLFSLYEPLNAGWRIILSTLISAVLIEFISKGE
ncbi:AzlC family ABC transporter permease [Fictibacillus sp. Mic-4]|uniref:AzlC family ABC transporter permease n=1 Tax=Fictibacillus TaxID=1329200 RepID=UPI00040F85BE|nr:AzlC family ABC transporter permease [Fictibacillus gelatini]